MSTVLENYLRIKNEVSNFPSATLIAVSKGQEFEKLETLYRAGHRDFGENYAQELCEKAERFLSAGARDVRWHMIGHVQTNKLKLILPHVSCIHTLDRPKLAFELSRKMKDHGFSGPLEVFIEVNIDSETTKSGIRPLDTQVLAKTCAGFQELQVLGLMCIPTPGPSDAFRRLAELELNCRPHTQGKLSMGMSADYLDALRAGSTHVRVGSAIFGERV
jgi:pyridoxal phosphate enzyme (YggS family)